jgi:NAD+--asparagine ADP-ribosyltransferase
MSNWLTGEKRVAACRQAHSHASRAKELEHGHFRFRSVAQECIGCVTFHKKNHFNDFNER